MHATGAGVLKIAVATRCLADCIPLLEVGATLVGTCAWR